MTYTGLMALLAFAPTPPAGTAPNPKAQMTQMLLTFAFMGVAMYVLMIRPQQKKARELSNLMKALKAGDKVVTNSGIIGTVLSVKDRTVSLRSADTKLEILKSAVSEITEKGAATTES